GERPAGNDSSGTTALAGTAAGLALLAGAGTLVVRRRNG
ncbi:LPXTG cell wall anchor domain-containing protein, partial [Streptomyces rhizosphaericola]